MVCRLFLIIFILGSILTCGFIATFAFPETFIIETSEGDKELFVPNTYGELREAYIEMSELYIEESIDLEKCLQEVDSSLKLVSELEEITGVLQKSNQELSDALTKLVNEKKKKELFQGYLSTYFQRSYKGSFNGGVGLNTIIKETVNVGVGVSLQSLQISVGIRIF